MIRKSLRPYQQNDLEQWRGKTSLGLFHEQRVGKNLSALAIVDHEKPERLSIITTKKGIAVWKKEIAESLDRPRWELNLLNFSQIQNQSTFRRLARWLEGHRSFMIVDEAHRIKRRGSKWSRRCRALGRRSRWRLALTGTPIAQGIHDVWAIFDFLDPAIFGPWSEFQSTYCIMGGYRGKKVVGHRNLDRFNVIFHAHSVRKTLAEVKREAGHAPLRVRRIFLRGRLGCERSAYQELEADLRTVVNAKRIETPLVITLATKLQQVCGGSILDEDGVVHPLGDAKLKLLEQTLDRIDDRPLIICRFLHELDAIERILFERKYTVKRIQGGIEFDPTQPITETAILMQIQSGVAIDLAITNMVIFYSWNFSYIDHEQSRFRVLQYNSTRVTYYFLVMEDTIDELILEAIQRKRRFATLVCDHYRRTENDRRAEGRNPIPDG